MLKNALNTQFWNSRFVYSRCSYLIACLFVVVLCLYQPLSMAADNMIATRVWPAQDYTRITLESSKPFTYKMQVIQNPDRVVLDIENIELSPLMKSFNDKVLPTDPYIKQIRVARFQQDTVRLVVDLKGEAKANAFVLKPMSEYQHRLVLDLRPVHDPIMAMLAERDKAESAVSVSETKVASTVDEQTLQVSETQTASVSGTETPINVAHSQSKEVKHPVTTTNNPADVAQNATIETKPVEPKPINKVDTSKSETTDTAANVDQESKVPVKKVGRQIIIAIDAGHGGEDPGARGASGSREKDITLIIAKRLKQKIDEEPNMQAVLTRDSDFFIPLHGRVVKARAMQADLFISIHADAFTNQSARGSSVFALSEKGATSASARYLAKKENESDLIGGVSLMVKDPVLAKTLLDLSQTATINDSLKLGKAVLGKVGEINKLHTSHVEQAGFAVLKSPDIPSILVETAFISNPEEEKRLNDENYQSQLASSIVAGIKKYFASNPALAKHANQKDR
jgi:N-acetylmuramoyl-L-alanine amidase